MQAELTLFAESNAAAIAALLRRSPDWLSAAAILARLQWPDTEANRRAVRYCIEQLFLQQSTNLSIHQSDLVISGQRGYKHIDNSTVEEVRHFAHWMKSQGGKMVARAEAALSRKGL